MQTWIIYHLKTEAGICPEFGAETLHQRKQFESSCQKTDCVIDYIPLLFQENLTLCLKAGKLLYLLMGVFGINTKTAKEAQFQRVSRSIGYLNSKEMLQNKKEILES